MTTTKEELEAAQLEINENLKQMDIALKKAQEIADKFGLKFKVSLTVPNPPEYSEYGNPEVSGTYYGKKGEEDGHFYWANSSLNC